MRQPTPPEQVGAAVRIDLDVPPGTIVFLGPGEWYTTDGEPASEPVLVSLVSVDLDMAGGLVAGVGHECNPRDPECRRHHCWEGRILVPALRAQVPSR
jgi:hypothetical protein